MKSRHFKSTLICLAVLGALAASPVMAQTATPPDTSAPTSTTNNESTRLSTEFAGFAGSDANAQALVTGLRDGTDITLDEVTTNADGTTTTTGTTFTPATGQLGYGNVKIALSLAEASLAQSGIADPTAAELEAALNGGTLVLADGTSIDLNGVLAARAAGEGWGEIANSMGFKLGDVMRSPNAAGSAAANAHAHAGVAVAKVEFGQGHLTDRPSATDHSGRPDFAGRPDVANKPTIPDRPQRPERPERPQIPDHPTHVGRPGG
ncbi:MAG TPA: hypothetical protein VIQ48_10690 [Rhodanobacter sp.]|jgi:hypothetical protein